MVKDKKPCAYISLSLSDNHFEQVQEYQTARELGTSVCNIYGKHTLLNQLAARRKFYTASMKEGDKVLGFTARIRQYASSLKSMGVEIEDKDKRIRF